MLKEKDRLLLKIERLEAELERSRKMVDITAFYWGSLTVHKDKWFNDHINHNIDKISIKDRENYRII